MEVLTLVDRFAYLCLRLTVQAGSTLMMKTLKFFIICYRNQYLLLLRCRVNKDSATVGKTIVALISKC